ncbi:MAG: hypothetical protein Q8L07_04215 [Sediminibacterium sp.]|nr:hypothetical protein [Sediminibacterium sp.]
MAKNNAYKTIAMQALGITGGQIAANFLGKIGPLATNDLIRGGVQSVGGVIVAAKLGKKNTLIESAGVGMAAQGIKTLIGKFVPSLVAGLGGVPQNSLAGTTTTYMVDQTKESLAGPFNNAETSLAGVDSSLVGEAGANEGML